MSGGSELAKAINDAIVDILVRTDLRQSPFAEDQDGPRADLLLALNTDIEIITVAINADVDPLMQVVVKSGIHYDTHESLYKVITERIPSLLPAVLGYKTDVNLDADLRAVNNYIANFKSACLNSLTRAVTQLGWPQDVDKEWEVGILGGTDAAGKEYLSLGAATKDQVESFASAIKALNEQLVINGCTLKVSMVDSTRKAADGSALKTARIYLGEDTLAVVSLLLSQRPSSTPRRPR